MGEEKWKKHKKGRKLKTISFDEETVPQHIAKEILENENAETIEANSNNEGNQSKLKTKKKKDKKKVIVYGKTVEESSDAVIALNGGIDLAVHKESKIKKKKKSKKSEDANEETLETPNETQINENDHVTKKRKKLNTHEVKEVSEENPSEDKTKESIRERKRKKYAKLLEDKKIKTELALQQKSLNYLSKWKHSRNEWKFEKLRQIWLQHNMFDDSKIPEEFWETLVEYFSNSKGKARDVLLKEALKIIEQESTEENEKSCRIQRARDIIQNLQE